MSPGRRFKFDSVRFKFDSARFEFDSARFESPGRGLAIPYQEKSVK
jgi:hypothetical protein